MKLKAATLIESLVAMVIIMLCFGVSAMIYINVLNGGNYRLKLNAHARLSEIAIESKNKKNFIDREIAGEKLDVKVSFSSYKGSELSLMHIAAYDKQGKLIGTRKEIISVE